MSACSLQQLVWYFTKLGTLGWGGPVALAGYMHHDLVEKKQWLSDEDYKEGLALAQLAPGPLAAQLAIYIGYVHHKIVGATLVGVAFVLPSFIMVVLIGMAYIHFEGLPFIQSVFYGVGASVVGIIAISAYRLARKTMRSDPVLWLLFSVMAITTLLTEREIIWIILAAGVVNLVARSQPTVPGKFANSFAPLVIQVAPVATDSALMQIALFFGMAGAFVFGSGLAIVPFLYGGVVKEMAWLNEQQFLDAVAVAMITPGPVVITVGFIGYLVAGFPGACVAALATFLPCYLFTVLPAPYFKKYGSRPAIKRFVDGVTAAATGAIAGSVLVIARRTFTDYTSIGLAIMTIVLLIHYKKLREPVIILIAAVAGILIKSVAE